MVSEMKSYLRMTEKTPLYRAPGEGLNERHAVPGKVYEILQQVNGWANIRFGKIRGWIPEFTFEVCKKNPNYRLTVAWDYVAELKDNEAHYAQYINTDSFIQGLDVISPTWITREGDPKDTESIQVLGRGDREYVRRAHEHGYEVWGLIADFNYDRNFAVYHNPEIVKWEIQAIVGYALALDLDGINIDFEGFGSRCRKAYSAYVRELAARLREHNLWVSIDMTKESPSDAWGQCYDRVEIANDVDYLVLMAYDEHGRLDVLPGSTGSLPWVEEGIQELLGTGIPKEKILLGVPFYTRNWEERLVQAEKLSVLVNQWEGIALYETPDNLERNLPLSPGELLGLVEQRGEWFLIEKNNQHFYLPVSFGQILKPGETMYITRSVDPLPANGIQEILLSYEPRAEFDLGTGQERLTYLDESGSRHEIWVEDERSLAARINLVHKYDLPGIAAWMLTQEKQEMWTVIQRGLHPDDTFKLE